jgi:hypothetical protein
MLRSSSQLPVQNSGQLTTQLSPRLTVISHQLPSLLFLDWLSTDNWTLSLTNQLLHVTSLNWTPDNSQLSQLPAASRHFTELNSWQLTTLWATSCFTSLHWTELLTIHNSQLPAASRHFSELNSWQLTTLWATSCFTSLRSTELPTTHNSLSYQLLHVTSLNWTADNSQLSATSCFTSLHSTELLTNLTAARLLSSLNNLGADPTENTASNNPYIVVMGGCLATDWISFPRERVYRPLSGCLFTRLLRSNGSTRCPFRGLYPATGQYTTILLCGYCLYVVCVLNVNTSLHAVLCL